MERFRPNIDGGIQELVIALNELGFQTRGSCEGHLPKTELLNLYPWVTYRESDDSKVSKLIKLIELFNATSGSEIWIVEDFGFNWLKPDHDATNKEELHRMQESGKRLAAFLKENY